jgi:hypothetical protein
MHLSVNGSELKITTNLDTALRCVRHATEPRRFWIDGICINQADAHERSQQVMRMGDIFSCASSVVAWLGEEADGSASAIGIIARFAAAWDGYARDGVNLGDSVRNIEHAFDADIWAAILRLFERPWWTRLWIYQEVVLAQQVTILCGKSSLDWLQLHQAFALWSGLLLPQNSGYLSVRETGPVVLVLGQSLWTNLVNDRAKRAYKLNMTMLELLRNCIHRQSTDPRDRIYAIFGLAQDAGDFGKPNYTKPVEQVFTDFARTHITRDHSLALLCYARSGLITPEDGISRHLDFEKLPSWVPHWTWGNQTGRLAPDHFDATPHASAVFHFESTADLCIQGGLIDTVAHVEAPPFLHPEKHRWVNVAVGNRAADMYPTGITRLQAFFRTLLTDCIGPRTARLDAYPTELFNLACAFLYLLPTYNRDSDLISVETVEAENLPDYELGLRRFLGGAAEGLSRQDLLAKYFGTSLAAAEAEADIFRGRKNLKSFIISEARETRGRCLFTTEKGYIGLSPSRIQARDKICIFPGCPLPLALREDGAACFQLVGECFVLGIMDGEGLDMLGSGDGQVPLREICVR